MGVHLLPASDAPKWCADEDDQRHDGTSLLACMTDHDRLWWDTLLARSARRQRRAAFALRWWQRLKPLAAASAVCSGLYVASFVWQFELLGMPVRNNDHGWLGPPLRRDPQVVDIGKIYYYNGTEYSSYRIFRPLARLWLRANGF
jgi:hypothetical protein